MPVIPATLEAEIREIVVQGDRGSKPAWANSLGNPISKTPIIHIKKGVGLVEWLKVQVLSSNLSIAKKKAKKPTKGK
jgi:hypothetical protein